MIQKVVMGNWKMHTDTAQAQDLARAVSGLVGDTPVQVVVCPPFTSLGAVADVIKGSSLQLGGQNLHWGSEGAYTGEVSGSMLRAVGCSHVLVGHSERRSGMGETVEITALKLKAALSCGLKPVLCVGEDLSHRQHGMTRHVVGAQVSAALMLERSEMAEMLFAYEPVWAIGSGQAALPEDADQVSSFIRELVEKIHGSDLARSIPVLYGGSVKPENAAGFLSRRNVDGVLVGGASLKAQVFAELVCCAEEASV